jgi:hypothetical protein
MALLRNVDKYIYWDNLRKSYLPQFWRREILPSWLMFNFSSVPTDNATIPAVPLSSPPFTFLQPYTSVEGLDQNLGTPFEVRSLTFADLTDGSVLANFTVMLKEVGEVRQFMNQPVHIRTLAGNGQTPALLREPFMFRSQHNISAQFTKVLGGATTARLYLEGAQYFPWSPEFMRKKESHQQLVNIISQWYKRRNFVTPFWLTTDTPVNLLANGQAEFFSKVGDDGHIEIFTFAAVATGNFDIEISEPKTKQTIMNGRITQTNGFGDANFPTLLPSAWLIPAGYRIRYLIRNLTAAPNLVFVTMGARKIYAPFIQREFGPIGREIAVPTPADTPSQIVPAPMI